MARCHVRGPRPVPALPTTSASACCLQAFLSCCLAPTFHGWLRRAFFGVYSTVCDSHAQCRACVRGPARPSISQGAGAWRGLGVAPSCDTSFLLERGLGATLCNLSSPSFCSSSQEATRPMLEGGASWGVQLRPADQAPQRAWWNARGPIEVESWSCNHTGVMKRQTPAPERTAAAGAIQRQGSALLGGGMRMPSVVSCCWERPWQVLYTEQRHPASPVVAKRSTWVWQPHGAESPKESIWHATGPRASSPAPSLAANRTAPAG